MKEILLLNGGKKFGNSGARLSQTLHDVAKETLQDLGYNVDETIIDKGYDEPKELQKWLKSDVIIWQMPGWWMGEPWIVKEYIDKVLILGGGTLFANDGRHHENPSQIRHRWACKG